MSPRKRRYWRNAAFALLLLVVAAWVVPSFFNTARYRPMLKAALERSLHRNVTFGHIGLHFFPDLGFTLNNVVVDEAPAFGAEPFISVSRIDCDIRWRSLWHSHLTFGTLQLHHPSINIVRNSAGEWNIENLLLRSGITKRLPGHASPTPPSNLAIDIEDARLNFKVGQNKKPFAIVNTDAHLDFDYGSDRVNFRIAGDPVRIDMEYPTPGLVELDGSWNPARALGHTLDATLRTQGAVLYDWVPLLTGQNPELYGVMNSTIHLGGSLRDLKFSGEAHLTQLHRWEQLPSSNHLPCDLHFRGQFNRDDENLSIRSLDLSFGSSVVHLEGAIAKITSKPDLDLVVAFERSRLQDLMRLGMRVMGKRVRWDLSGRLNGMIAVRGPWNGQHYGGFLNAHAVRLDTTSGTFPVSNVSIRITRYGVRMAPARVRLAPGVEIVAEGIMRHISSIQSRPRSTLHPIYDLTLYSHAVNLRRLLDFGRALDIAGTRHLEAQGIGSFTLHLTGGAWPWTTPSVTAEGNVRSARLLFPGLRQPLNIPRARIQVYGKQIIVNPLLAVMGTSVFSGWIMHQRGSREPWNFNLKADRLSIGQASQWFDGIGNQASSSFLARLSDLSSLISGHRPSFHLAKDMDVRGRFSTPLVTYRALTLHNFQAGVEIHNRKVHFTRIRFDAGGGRGGASLLVDLAKTPAYIAGQASISGALIQDLGRYLPLALAKTHGHYSAVGDFAARGLTRTQVIRTLHGRATMKFEDVDLGTFNPIRILARRSGMDVPGVRLEPLSISSATAHLEIRDRELILQDFPVELSGAKFEMQGRYAFDGSARLRVRADLRGVRQPWVPIQPHSTGPHSRMADLRFTGTLRNLEIVPPQISQTQP